MVSSFSLFSKFNDYYNECTENSTKKYESRRKKEINSFHLFPHDMIYQDGTIIIYCHLIHLGKCQKELQKSNEMG